MLAAGQHPQSCTSASHSPIDLDYFLLPISHLYAGSHSSHATPLHTPSDLFDGSLPALHGPSPSCAAGHVEMDTSRLAQLHAAAKYDSRSQRQPMQGEQHMPAESSSTDSSDSNDSNASDTDSINLESFIRCCRCHRSVSTGVDPAKSGMISFGTNLYYCSRCASLVGYHR